MKAAITKALLIFSSSALLGLASCGIGGSQSSSTPASTPSSAGTSEETTSKDSPKESSPLPSSEDRPREGASSEESRPSSEEGSSQSESSDDPYLPFDPFDALEEALSNPFDNYSSFTGMLPGDYGDPIQFLTYYAEDYQIVYDYNVSTMYETAYYNYFHDYEGVSHIYFDTSSYPKGKTGWISYNDEVERGLGLPFQYADNRAMLELLAENIDKFEYAFGLYWFDDLDVLSEIVDLSFASAAYVEGKTEFYFPDWTNVNVLALDIDETTNTLTRIRLFNDEIDPDTNIIQIEFDNYGAYSLNKSPLASLPIPDEPNEDNVISWWEYSGRSGPIVNAYPSSATVSASIGEPGQSLNLEIEDSFRLSHTCGYEGLEGIAEDRIIYRGNNYGEYRYVSTNPEVVEIGSIGTVTAVGAGEADVYAIVYKEDGTEIESTNRIHVKVNPLAEQNLEDAVYNLSFDYYENVDSSYRAVYDENGFTPVHVTNALANHLPVKMELTKDAWLVNTASSGPFKGKNTVSMSMRSGTSYAKFGFSDQQVSGVSFYYGGYYTNFKQDLDWLDYIRIETSLDGENWINAADITEEVTSHGSLDNLKLLERSFAPANFVRLAIHSKNGFIGKEASFAFSSIAFLADDSCHSHVDPSSNKLSAIEISSVTGLNTVRVGKTLQFRANLTPSEPSNPDLTWASSNPEVASISSSGLLSGVTSGTTEVYATDDSGTVKSNVVEITITEMPSVDSNLLGEWESDDLYSSDSFTCLIDGQKAVLTFKDSTLTLPYIDYEDEGRKYVFSDGTNTFKASYSSSNSNVSFILEGTHNINIYTENTFLNKLVRATSVSLSCSKQGNLKIGESAKISISFDPTNSTKRAWKLVSSNPEIVRIDNGFFEDDELYESSKTIVAVSSGTATLTATTEEGLTTTIEITVEAPVLVTSIEVQASDTEVKIGKSITATANVLPGNADNAGVTWSSSDNAIATVDQNGVIKGISQGEVTITATAKDGSNVSGSITISVVLDEAAASVTYADFAGDWADMDGNISFTFAEDTSFYIMNVVSSDYTDEGEVELNNGILHIVTYFADYYFELGEEDTLTLTLNSLGDISTYTLYK